MFAEGLKTILLKPSSKTTLFNSFHKVQHYPKPMPDKNMTREKYVCIKVSYKNKKKNPLKTKFGSILKVTPTTKRDFSQATVVNLPKTNQ